MKAITILFPVVLFIASSNVSQDKEMRTFKHPTLNFSFSSSGEWKNNPYHKDKMIYEMVNAETGIHVMLWYNGGTESTCERYLVKMADMKGLQWDKPVMAEINKDTTRVLTCRGLQNGDEVVNILAALSYKEKYGPDAPLRSQGKTYNALHIAQVWCPAARYEQNKMMMQDIVNSLALEKH